MQSVNALIARALGIFWELIRMKRFLMLVWLAAIAALPFPQAAQAGHSEYDALISSHAAANSVPEALVHRVIVRESRYQANLVGRCGCIGLMQIKLATARSLGYTGDAQGLRDPNTNLTYGVKYLAGAYRAANCDHNRTMHYYASGYYEAAKRQRVAERHPHNPVDLTPHQLAKNTTTTTKNSAKSSIESSTAGQSAESADAAASEVPKP
jgi:soluble lytic murein transglycosylase-like protein